MPSDKLEKLEFQEYLEDALNQSNIKDKFNELLRLIDPSQLRASVDPDFDPYKGTKYEDVIVSKAIELLRKLPSKRAAPQIAKFLSVGLKKENYDKLYEIYEDLIRNTDSASEELKLLKILSIATADIGKLPRIKEKQYEAGKIDRIEDNSSGQKNLNALSSIWSPLLLHKEGEESWTPEEVIDAFEPYVDSILYSVQGEDINFQNLKSWLLSKVLYDIMRTDKGKSPFAAYAKTALRRAILKPERVEGMLDALGMSRSTQQKLATGIKSGGAASLDAPVGTDESGSTLGDLTQGEKAMAAVECPTCSEVITNADGSIKRNESGEPVVKGTGTIGPFESEEDAEEFAAEHGIDVPPVGEKITCPTCEGRGTIPAPQTARDPQATETAQQFIEDLFQILKDPQKMGHSNVLTDLQDVAFRLETGVGHTAEDLPLSEKRELLAFYKELEELFKFALEEEKTREVDSILAQYTGRTIGWKSPNDPINMILLIASISNHKHRLELMEDLRNELTDKFKQTPVSQTRFDQIIDSAKRKIMFARDNELDSEFEQKKSEMKAKLNIDQSPLMIDIADDMKEALVISKKISPKTASWFEKLWVEIADISDITDPPPKQAKLIDNKVLSMLKRHHELDVKILGEQLSDIFTAFNATYQALQEAQSNNAAILFNYIWSKIMAHHDLKMPAPTNVDEMINHFDKIIDIDNPKILSNLMKNFTKLNSQGKFSEEPDEETTREYQQEIKKLMESVDISAIRSIKEASQYLLDRCQKVFLESVRNGSRDSI